MGPRAAGRGFWMNWAFGPAFAEGLGIDYQHDRYPMKGLGDGGVAKAITEQLHWPVSPKAKLTTDIGRVSE